VALWQGKSQRKPTGGRRRPQRKKRKFEISRELSQTVVAKEERREILRVRGGNEKVRVLGTARVNVVNPKTGKVERADVVTVKQNPANPNYVQRNFVNRGAIVETSVGLARITSRPGQDGVINAVLVEP
jgi:small subunit ribosomal protein S8e